jgi:hypothetical protein
MSQGSSVGVATGYRLDDRGPGVDSRRWLRIFLFIIASRPVLEPIQPPIQWVPRALSPGVDWSGRETDHSSLSSAEVMNCWRYALILPPPPPVRLHGVLLGQTQGQLYLLTGSTNLICAYFSFVGGPFS